MLLLHIMSGDSIETKSSQLRYRALEKKAAITEFGIRDNVPNTGRFLGHLFFGIRDIVLDI